MRGVEWSVGCGLALALPSVIPTIPSLSFPPLHQIFLGQLRDAELERISERVSQAVVETCLAMTIFREDVSPLFMAMFVVVSFLKIFHWLVADRVDFIDTNPSVPMLTHFRLVSFNLLLLASVVW